MHPRRWRWALGKLHWELLKVTLNDGVFNDIHFNTWDKLYVYAMGSIGHQYYYILSNFLLYNFFDKNLFEEVYIYKFFNRQNNQYFY